mmetsp:Transcript_21175/g.59255  ORF Transcript_21175/g.59255 Transcript_21175/m.59255 type:complete len:114 (-) Transcript_21175:495-836(-)
MRRASSKVTMLMCNSHCYISRQGCCYIQHCGFQSWKVLLCKVEFRVSRDKFEPSQGNVGCEDMEACIRPPIWECYKHRDRDQTDASAKFHNITAAGNRSARKPKSILHQPLRK